ncbi:MAG: 30S ribosomal protein S12 methylthiotransferase RimO [Armatimonadota bacterium]
MSATVALVSLGCPKNLVDSEVMLGLLEQAGYRIVEETVGAEVVIVNTCAFIAPAVEEAIEALLDLSELKGSGTRCLICAGCLTSRYGAELMQELPEVDGFIGPGSVGEIVALVDRCLAGERPLMAAMPPWLPEAGVPRLRTGPEWLAYVKVADGCSHRCSYCMIPSLRGPYRSRPLEDIQAEVAGLLAEGVREMCLIAQDTSAWGSDLQGGMSLAGLIGALDLRGWDGWLRLQYLHPDGITDELLAAVAETPQVVPYFDIPLQHADREILRAMGRRGDGEQYLRLIEHIRDAVPGAALRTTFIVGHPGESRERFERLLRFVAQARFDRLSAFRYWEEAETVASHLDAKVPPEEAQDRLDELMALQAGISREINQACVGTTMRVLVEEPGERPEEMLGRSFRDAPEVDGNVIVSAPRGAVLPAPGGFVDVLITEALEHDLRGRLHEHSS